MIKKKILIITLMFLLLLFSISGFALDYLYPAKVERIIDGDTVVVEIELDWIFCFYNPKSFI